MGEESVFPEMVLPVIEMILTLLSFVCEVELGELSKGTEAKHSKCAWQTSHRAAATFYRALEQLTMDVFHVLE